MSHPRLGAVRRRSPLARGSIPFLITDLHRRITLPSPPAQIHLYPPSSFHFRSGRDLPNDFLGQFVTFCLLFVATQLGLQTSSSSLWCKRPRLIVTPSQGLSQAAARAGVSASHLSLSFTRLVYDLTVVTRQTSEGELVSHDRFATSPSSLTL